MRVEDEAGREGARSGEVVGINPHMGPDRGWISTARTGDGAADLWAGGGGRGPWKMVTNGSRMEMEMAMELLGTYLNTHGTSRVAEGKWEEERTGTRLAQKRRMALPKHWPPPPQAQTTFYGPS